MELDIKSIKEQAVCNASIFDSSFNLKEEAWRSAVLESALEALGHSVQELWTKYPEPEGDWTEEEEEEEEE
jgi:hypothetical protein